MSTYDVAAAEIVLPCTDLTDTLAFFTGTLGFQLRSIFPADSPAVAVIEGHGVRVRLDRHANGEAGVLRLLCRGTASGSVIAPNGTRIEIVEFGAAQPLPALVPAFVLTRGGGGAHWEVGRAGMRYRDLIPNRLGGRYIASHIAIPGGGPVPDYVHHHAIRFQMIYCRAGWVRVVYEDQGGPFVMHPGDCVLQPPHIRHRVLESSPGLEVIEIACPALHETLAEHAMDLPNLTVNPARDFHGQRFVRHVAADAKWERWRVDGFECRNIGIDAATGGLADVCVVRPRGTSSTPFERHDKALKFLFVLEGGATLHASGEHPLRAGDSVTIPAGMPCALSACSADLQWLEVTS